MSKNDVLKGVLLVALGATSYGMLATFVKLSYKDGFTTAEVTVSQFILGILGVLLINYFKKKTAKGPVEKASPKNVAQLMLAGTSMGFTSIFYYLCVRYINVSIAIVLLMQTVWMGVLLEWIIDKKAPSPKKIIAVMIVLTGTVMATNLLRSAIVIDWRGIFWGMLAAASFTATMATANRTVLHISSAQRSLYMLLGGAVVVFVFALSTQNTPFNYGVFFKWGLFVALFGTIIPPLLLNAGFPKTGIGLGSIVSSLELPVSVMMAFLILGETVLFTQWMGIALILFAIVIMNVKVPFSKSN